MRKRDLTISKPGHNRWGKVLTKLQILNVAGRYTSANVNQSGGARLSILRLWFSVKPKAQDRVSAQGWIPSEAWDTEYNLCSTSLDRSVFIPPLPLQGQGIHKIAALFSSRISPG